MTLECGVANSLIKTIVDDPTIRFTVKSEEGRCVCWIYGLSPDSNRVQRIRDELEVLDYYSTVPREVRLPSGLSATVFSFATSAQALFGSLQNTAERQHGS